MSNRVLITGDRSAPPLVTLLSVAAIMLREVAKNPAVEIVTGELPGVETAVRELSRCADRGQYVMFSDDLAARATEIQTARSVIDRAYFVHVDPQASRLLPALLQEFGDDLEIVVPQVAFA